MFKSFIFISLIALYLPAFGQQDNVKKHENISKSGLAIEGYDPVAYFYAGKPTEGKKGISTTDGGVTYYFSSTQNLDFFKAEPQKHFFGIGIHQIGF